MYHAMVFANRFLYYRVVFFFAIFKEANCGSYLISKNKDLKHFIRKTIKYFVFLKKNTLLLCVVSILFVVKIIF